jgi:hypothetical protein
MLLSSCRTQNFFLLAFRTRGEGQRSALGAKEGVGASIYNRASVRHSASLCGGDCHDRWLALRRMYVDGFLKLDAFGKRLEMHFLVPKEKKR